MWQSVVLDVCIVEANVQLRISEEMKAMILLRILLEFVLSLRSSLVLSLVVYGGSRAIHSLPGEGTRVLWMSCRYPRW